MQLPVAAGPYPWLEADPGPALIDLSHATRRGGEFMPHAGSRNRTEEGVGPARAAGTLLDGPVEVQACYTVVAVRRACASDGNRAVREVRERVEGQGAV